MKLQGSARGLPRYHLEYAGSLPFRRAFFPDGRTTCALNQGIAVTGLPGLIYWPALRVFFSRMSRRATFRETALTELAAA
jgi:hypothetical protein